METKVSLFLCLHDSASLLEENKTEVGAGTIYDVDLQNMVKDLEELLEDRIEVFHHIFVSAGHDHDRTLFQVNIINILIL